MSGPIETPRVKPASAQPSLIRAMTAMALSGVMIGDAPSSHVQGPHCITMAASKDFEHRTELKDIEAGSNLIGKTFTVSYPQLDKCPKISVCFIRDRGTNEIGVEVNGKTFINENSIQMLLKNIPVTSLVDQIVTLEEGDIRVKATNYGHADISYEQLQDLLLVLMESKESNMDIETDVKFVAENESLHALAEIAGLNAEKKILKVRKINPKRLALRQ